MRDAIEPRQVYGGRAKALGPVRVAAINRLPEFEIKLDGVMAGTLNPPFLFPFSLEAEGKNRIHLEIGCGTGEHTAELAIANPDDLFLAAEPYQAGVANLMRIITTQNISNIRIYPNDGLALLKALKTASIDQAYLLFPDPWPKQRHHDRRFMQPETLTEFTRVVRPGGSLLLASDDSGMQAWMAAHMAACDDFTPQIPSPYQPQTRYAAKGLAAGKQPRYLYFIRK
jgi:tRNA (guanine-N7-)-methyltransferase